MEADQSAMRNKRIPLYQPDLSGNERRYVSECVESSWISSLGSFVGRFESAIMRQQLALPTRLPCAMVPLLCISRFTAWASV